MKATKKTLSLLRGHGSSYVYMFTGLGPSFKNFSSGYGEASAKQFLGAYCRTEFKRAGFPVPKQGEKLIIEMSVKVLPVRSKKGARK